MGQYHFVNSIVKGDKTSLNYYNVQTTSQNKVWVFEDKDKPLAVWKSRCVEEKMKSLF